ncbi:hypothetical protein QCA50_002144 [Cerrena zonata]|uniref:RNA exonuclease 4 n=1 Tax=Cerrena zonata TaxID=2478898 RepID=A0AAW0GNA3_9APHY
MSQKFPLPNPEDILAISTLVVGVGPGGNTSMLARVAVVDYRGQTLLSTYVRPTMTPVTDYRTSTTGIRPEHLTANGIPSFETVQAQVASLIRGKVLVGHCLWQDLSVLGIRHPAVATRDVALYQPFRNTLRSPRQIVGLQTLMWHLMRRRCQEEHQCALENARAVMDLYRSHATEWESLVSKGKWPCDLPPDTFSGCFL